MSEAAHSEWDVVIVGAGPVGGYLGRQFSRLGLSVLLLEEHRELGRPFQCAGLVTPAAMERVGLESTILSSVWGARIHSPNGRCVEVGSPDRIRTHVVCRKLFDEACVRQALDDGATVWLRSRPVEASVTENGVELKVSRAGEIHSIRCRLLCGADGAHSWVRRTFRMGRPKETMIGFQVELTGYDGYDDRLEMFTGSEVAPGLFAWVIPAGRSWRVGVWSRPEDLDGRSCEELVHRLRTHPLWAHRFEGSREVARYCGPLPCGMVAKPLRARLALFGDAAGLCKPTTGGGIGPAFDQVDLLAPGLAAAVEKDELGETAMQRIARPLKKMRKEQERARILRDLFLTSSDDDELERTFTAFSKPETLSLINSFGDIERPVPLGLRLLRDVPEFRNMAARATWALLRG